MITIYLLKILVDLSFYCSFLAFLSSLFGGTGAYIAVILQCVCYALSYLGGKRRIFRLLILLPMALGWLLCRASTADCVLLIPTALYILILVWRADYTLNLDRQQRLFSLFWKLLAVFVFVMLVTGNAPKLTITTIPYALVMLTCSVLLMRTLRHEPKVYLQWKYQLLNIGIAVVFLALAYLMSTPTFLRLCLAAAGGIYRNVLQPILQGLLACVLFLLQYVVKFVQLFVPEGGIKRKSGVSGEYNPYIDEIDERIDHMIPENMVDNFGTTLLVIAIVAVLIVLFIVLLKKRDAAAETFSFDTKRTNLAPEEREAALEQSTNVGAVRAQYRKYLKLCTSLGISASQSSTSRDINRQAMRNAQIGEVADPIREIYIKARYAGKADKESVRQIKKLYSIGKKNAK